ncbi:hypothetical protein GOP47_0011629 [Adiantum capillus-veneris]|uniref:GATA-type domain-containing protein n=1 Tax=Adiantum capillus-veneris TaxID=13818 RepID=A0A9D4ZI13_ADICA|nr:hypothetical protein GOP47_0011629 [Adiantum capillus-veneris]
MGRQCDGLDAAASASLDSPPCRYPKVKSIEVRHPETCRKGNKGMDSSCAEFKRAGSFNRGGGATEQEQGDFLAIEDLLDFSNEDIGGSIESYESNDSAPASSILLSGDELKASSVSSAATEKPSKQQQQQTLCLFEGDAGGSGELCVPCDDLAELEWLSNFVEESFSSADGAVLEGVLLHDDNVLRESKQAHRASPVSVLDHHRRGTHHLTSSTTSSTSVGGRHLLSPDHIYLSRPGRARSKRPRSAVCFWNTRILSITDDCNILEASCTSKLTSRHQPSSSSDSEGTLTLGYDDSDDFFISPTKKASSASKVPKSASNNTKGAAGAHAKSGQHAAVGDRRCLHCGSQRTPQWRAGPMGPKTLCNACGVRYKSGRLLPEYRPAASPTFVESIHSNSHRRVLEMRRQRTDELFTSGHVDQLGDAKAEDANFSVAPEQVRDDRLRRLTIMAVSIAFEQLRMNRTFTTTMTDVALAWMTQCMSLETCEELKEFLSAFRL